jgi:hypothetical protein
LVHLFFSEERLLEPSVTGDEALIVALTDYPAAQRLFFDSGAAKKPEKAAIKSLLLLLITADLPTTPTVCHEVARRWTFGVYTDCMDTVPSFNLFSCCHGRQSMGTIASQITQNDY